MRHLGAAAFSSRQPDVMYSYAVFGGTLSTDVPFPELPTGGNPSRRWLIRESRNPPATPLGVLAGEDEVDGSIRVRLYLGEAGHTLQYDDTGTFLIASDGHEITWSPGSDPDPECVRLDVLGRVLPLALQLQGHLCLHASAVALDDRAIAFIAPKFHGKSTLAQAVVNAGGSLVTDDVLPVDPGDQVQVLPGVQRTRLWADSARFVGVGQPTEPGGKLYVDLHPSQLSNAPLPLEAIYLLSPGTSDAGTTAAGDRDALSQLHATMELVRHSKLGPLTSGRGAAEVLDRAAEVATRIPVYRLQMKRDFGRLGDLVERLLEWHRPLLEARTAENEPSGVGWE